MEINKQNLVKVKIKYAHISLLSFYNPFCIFTETRYTWLSPQPSVPFLTAVTGEAEVSVPSMYSN